MSYLLAIISLSIVVVIHELGHFWTARKLGVKVEEFGIGFPPKIFSWKKGEVIYSLNAVPFGGFNRINEDKNEPHSFVNQSKKTQAIILIAGSLNNILYALLVFALLFALGMPTYIFAPSIQHYLFPFSSGQNFVRVPLYQVPLTSLQFTARLSFILIKGTFLAFKNLIFRGSLQGVVGPVGLVALTSSGFHKSVSVGIFFTGLISLALAIFNLLPIPIADGGKLFLLFIEKIRKKAIPARTQLLIDNICIALLITLALIITIKDVKFFFLK